MRIQAKLFLLLVVIAVLPLVALSWRSQVATERLGMAIADRGRAAVSSQVEAQLRQAVGLGNTILFQEQRLIELTLNLQAQDVERRLSGYTESDPNPIYFSTEYDDRKTWPPGTSFSDTHYQIASDGKSVAIPITRQDQSFFIPEGVEQNDVAPSLLRLSSMSDAYQRLLEEYGSLIYWQYTTLENGTHSVFPGHGGYPENYDPRERAWYRLAKAAGDLVWTPPLIDATTGELLLTAAKPVYGSDGEFAGVTAIDVQILSVLNRIQNQLQVGDQAEGFIVRLADEDSGVFVPGVTSGEPELLIVAYNGYQTQGADWASEIEAETLMGGAPGSLEPLIDDLVAQRDGLRRMPYQGRDSLWVYGKLQRVGATLLYVVPYSDIREVAEEAQEFIQVATDEQIQVASGASLLLILLVGGLAVYASRSVTGPLRDLSGMVSRLARGDFEARADVQGRDEISEVAQAFNAMVPRLKENMNVRQTLALASEVQQKLLPAHPPHINGLDIAGRSLYCDEIGGDYFDYLYLPAAGFGPRIGIAVGDVTGHGVPSALTMATVRALLRAKSQETLSLASVVNDVNVHMAEDSAGGRFVTLLYMVVEVATRTMRWVSAGHDPAIVYDPVKDTFCELEAKDIPLGVQGDWHFRESQRDEWNDGSIVVIGTDGVWEARNKAKEMFGKEALRDVIRRHAHRPAETICEAVSQALDAFRGEIAYKDDVTLVVIKFTPVNPDAET